MAYQGPPRNSFVKIVNPELNNEHAPAWFPYQTHQGAPVPGSLNQAFADPRRRARKRRQTLCYIAVTLAVCAIIILIAFLLAFFLTRKNKSDNGSTSTVQPVSGGSTTMHASTVSATNGEQSTVSGGTATAQASTLSSTIIGGSPSGSGGSTTVQVSKVSDGQSTVSLSGTPSSLPSVSSVDSTTASSIPAVETTTTRSLQGNCSLNQFQCGNGICIELVRHCDSIADCGDSSDEATCECNETTHFRCTQSRECLSLGWKCDGLPDCLDVSDESNCGGCNETFLFGCNNTDRCIKKEWRCDGNQDCPDDSDETGCVCNPDSLFTCASTGRCIKLSWVCDGENDCPDGSEERNCTSIVRPTTPATAPV